jgi:hypothetical protein
MQKQIIIFDRPEDKKHSVCYKTGEENPAVTSIYVMRSHLGNPLPKKIKVTVEELS